MTITIEPHGGPGYYHGSPAYTWNGIQLLKSSVDKMSTSEIYACAMWHKRSRIPAEKNLYAELYRARTNEDLPEPCHAGDGC